MSAGPLIPVLCPTIELKDLADTKDFEKSGNEGVVYGLELTQDRIYKRTAIEGIKRIRLEQIKNLSTAETKEDLKYVILKNKDGWVLTVLEPQIDYLLKFEFISPYTLMDKDNTFNKALNAGPMLISLVPEDRGSIIVKEFNKQNYLLLKRDAEATNVQVLLEPVLNIGQQATIILDIIAHKATQSNVRIIPQVELGWTNLSEEPKRIIVFMKKIDGQSKLQVQTSPQIVVTVANNPLTQLTHIKLDDLDLLGFYFSDSLFTDSQLEYIAENLKIK